MEWLNKYGKPIYILWSVISVLLIAVYIIVNFGFEKPITVGTEYFDGIKIESDSLEDCEDIPIIEFNITRSQTNPELNLTEMIITEYTDYAKNSYVRYGLQVLGDITYFCPEDFYYYNDKNEHARTLLYGTSKLEGIAQHSFVNDSVYCSGSIYFYIDDFDGDVRVSELNEIEQFSDSLIVTAGGINFNLEIGGADAKYSYTNEYVSTKGANWWNSLFNITHTQTLYNEYSIIDLFGYLSKSLEINASNVIKSFDNADLDRYFTITKDNGNGQFYSLSDVNTNNAYFRIKSTYQDITSHLNAKEHSLLGIIAEDVNFNSGVVNTATPYYSTGVELTLNASQFALDTHSAVSGSVLKLDSEFVKYLSSLNNLTLNINIDLDVFDENSIVGLDVSSFSNLKISSLFISSSVRQDFYVIGSLKNVSSPAVSGLNAFYVNGGV